MAFGEARLTNDIDVLVALTPPALPAFLVAFPFPDYYVSEDAARSAVRGGSMFNIIHPESGQNIDVIVPSNDFDRWQLSRTCETETNVTGGGDHLLPDPPADDPPGLFGRCWTWRGRRSFSRSAGRWKRTGCGTA